MFSKQVKFVKWQIRSEKIPYRLYVGMPIVYIKREDIRKNKRVQLHEVNIK